MKIADSFPRYLDHDPAMPIWCVTPKRGGCIHRFFDTPPFSPSGRYLAALRLPFEDRQPEPGDTAEVVLVDLAEGGERVVATTRGWEPQLGANLNWGADDDTLFFNDVEPGEWLPFAVKLNPHTGERSRLAGTVYHASPDGQTLASADMTRMGFTQPGYGVVVPDTHRTRHHGLADDDGLWLTDVASNTRRLAASIRQIVTAVGPDELRDRPDGFEVYGFHAKWNPQGDRLIFTLRWFPAGASPNDAFADQLSADWKVRFAVYTLNPDGSDIQLAVGPEHWAKRGHHINFTPDGQALSMNLGGWQDGHTLSLVRCGLDGSNLAPITRAVPGSGHPSVHPGGMILTDTYAHEADFVFGDGTTPLRWINPATGDEQHIARIHNGTAFDATPLRLDPHPVWDKSWQWIAFNAIDRGERRVFVADMRGLLTD